MEKNSLESQEPFQSKSKMVNLIKSLTFRALKICSDNRIKSEFEQMKNLFLSNGYLEEVNCWHREQNCW